MTNQERQIEYALHRLMRACNNDPDQVRYVFRLLPHEQQAFVVGLVNLAHIREHD